MMMTISYVDCWTPKQINKNRENKKKMQYADRVMETKQGSLPQAEWRMSVLTGETDRK